MSENKEVCKHCGSEFKSLNDMFRSWHSGCPSPTKRHEPFEKGIQDKYNCKHCGSEFKSLNDMFRSWYSGCPSPTKRHEPLNR